MNLLFIIILLASPFVSSRGEAKSTRFAVLDGQINKVNAKVVIADTLPVASRGFYEAYMQLVAPYLSEAGVRSYVLKEGVRCSKSHLEIEHLLFSEDLFPRVGNKALSIERIEGMSIGEHELRDYMFSLAEKMNAIKKSGFIKDSSCGPDLIPLQLNAYKKERCDVAEAYGDLCIENAVAWTSFDNLFEIASDIDLSELAEIEQLMFSVALHGLRDLQPSTALAKWMKETPSGVLFKRVAAIKLMELRHKKLLVSLNDIRSPELTPINIVVPWSSGYLGIIHQLHVDGFQTTKSSTLSL